MTGERLSGKELEFYPLTPQRWDDFEELFGGHGAYSGCWCMYWRITRARFAENGNAGNKRAMKALVDGGEVPGILAYHGGRAVGWCSVGPREVFGSLERSPKLRRVDDAPVWSVVCFYMAKDYRRRGLMALLLAAAVDYARGQGATIMEGYPISTGGDLTGCTGYMGIDKTFAAAGFEEVACPNDDQLIVRLHL
jgi:GNAT superfamily N-acetyltransferase